MSTTHTPITWGGLDFDTAALDAEIRTLLGRLCPPDGEVYKLKATASITAAEAAIGNDIDLLIQRECEAAGGDLEDLSPEEAALRAIHGAMWWLSHAQRALTEVDNARARAVRALESR